MGIARSHGDIICKICDKLRCFDGQRIDFYISGPGRGNLGAIVKHLTESGAWPIKAKWKVNMYSGAFNMNGMTEGDIDALSEIMACSDVPLVDIAKFPFFGGKACHACTASFTTFACDSFAGQLNLWAPQLAAALKMFNDEFNASLIYPGLKLFKCKHSLDEKLTKEEADRFQIIEDIVHADKATSINEYAKRVFEDSALFNKVIDFKKSTLVAFAFSNCDSPLCDQLVFLYEWLEVKIPVAIKPDLPGVWVFDRKKGFTQIVPKDAGDEGRILAIQPVLLDPYDEDYLTKMREALQSYLMRHLEMIYP